MDDPNTQLRLHISGDALRRSCVVAQGSQQTTSARKGPAAFPITPNKNETQLPATFHAFPRMRKGEEIHI